VACALLAPACKGDEKHPPAPEPAAAPSADSITIDARPPQKPRDVQEGDLQLGLYAVKKAWRSDACDPNGLTPADEDGVEYFYTLESALGGYYVAFQGCRHDADRCKSLYAALVRGESHEDFTVDGLLQLLLMQRDESGRLFGESYFSGRKVENRCEDAFSHEGWVERAGDGLRVAVRERRGDYPAPDAGMCQTLFAKRHLADKSCTLLVYELTREDAPPKVPCEGRPECKSDGRCTEQGDRCVAASDADCERASGCKYEGECTAQDARCIVGSDGDCKQTETCSESGYCWAVPSREGGGALECLAKTAEDCAKSGNCRSQGDCALTDGGLCRPSTDAHCAQSSICKDKGLCKKGFDTNNPRYACVKG
jgi:hypothetical protein